MSTRSTSSSAPPHICTYTTRGVCNSRDGVLPPGAWHATDATLTAGTDGRFGLYNASGLPVPLWPTMQNEFYSDPKWRQFDYGGWRPCGDGNVVPRRRAVFVVTARHPREQFGLHDSLSHGLGIFELFSQALPAAAHAPLVVLRTGHHALTTGKLQLLGPHDVGNNMLLPAAAMGLTVPELAERMGWFWNATRGGRGGCVHAQHVWGGHAIFDVTTHAHAYLHRRGASPRLAAFRQAVASTLLAHDYRRRLPRDGGGDAPLVGLFPLRTGIRKIVNEEELRASDLARRVARATGVELRFVRFERMRVVEQFEAVVTARLIVGNHGAAFVWATMLPTDVGGCAALELWANESSDGLPVDTSHYAAINGVAYAKLAQPTAPRCVRRLIRECGDIVVDVEQLHEALLSIAPALHAGMGNASAQEAAAPAHADQSRHRKEPPSSR